ncbi:permease-like cell division protein FtsX [Asanoa sp. NPDC050611]
MRQREAVEKMIRDLPRVADVTFETAAQTLARLQDRTRDQGSCRRS